MRIIFRSGPSVGISHSEWRMVAMAGRREGPSFPDVPAFLNEAFKGLQSVNPAPQQKALRQLEVGILGAIEGRRVDFGIRVAVVCLLRGYGVGEYAAEMEGGISAERRGELDRIFSIANEIVRAGDLRRLLEHPAVQVGYQRELSMEGYRNMLGLLTRQLAAASVTSTTEAKPTPAPKVVVAWVPTPNVVEPQRDERTARVVPISDLIPVESRIPLPLAVRREATYESIVQLASEIFGVAVEDLQKAEVARETRALQYLVFYVMSKRMLDMNVNRLQAYIPEKDEVGTPAFNGYSALTVIDGRIRRDASFSKFVESIVNSVTPTKVVETRGRKRVDVAAPGPKAPEAPAVNSDRMSQFVRVVMLDASARGIPLGEIAQRSGVSEGRLILIKLRGAVVSEEEHARITAAVRNLIEQG